jgi:hypothetical protein
MHSYIQGNPELYATDALNNSFSFRREVESKAKKRKRRRRRER